jgi:hypothetical protein
MRIKKDYTQRGKRVPPTNVGSSESADQAKLGGGAGAGQTSQGNREQMIAHEKSTKDRIQRSTVPNSKLKA